MTLLYTEVHETDLHARLLNPEASFALTTWSLARGQRKMPEEQEVQRLKMDWLRQDLMILRPDQEGDLVYEFYGERIRNHAGFDMTGLRVKDFKGALGDFFQAIYADVLANPRAVATIHRLGCFLERPLWERIILPFARDGVVSALYVINRARQLGQDFNLATAQSQGNGVIALQFTRGDKGQISDAIIVGANLTAREMTGRRLDELLDQSMRKCFPGIVEHGLWDRYLEVAQSRETQRLVLAYDKDGMSGNYEVKIAPFRDGVTIDFCRAQSAQIAA